ncbi:MAG: ATP-binding cassette domain-containing protein, partial [Thermoleophilaceae bacterium]|nr:ATP-binding cassette domain-containing protein [Thermoleophilaceae bacterium]
MADGITAEPAIKIEGVTKRYRLGAGYGADATISHRIDSALRAPLRKLRGETKPEEGEDFLALDGVSLEIPEGQMLGLVGANGAGKSTLLKLLARITAPSEGRIEIRGQVGSLLEVGTGFHPELTGR